MKSVRKKSSAQGAKKKKRGKRRRRSGRRSRKRRRRRREKETARLCFIKNAWPNGRAVCKTNLQVSTRILRQRNLVVN